MLITSVVIEVTSVVIEVASVVIEIASAVNLTSAMSHPQSLHCYVNENMLHLLHPLHLKDFQQVQRKLFIYSILYRYQTLFKTRIIVQKCAHLILYKSIAVTSYCDTKYQHKGYCL